MDHKPTQVSEKFNSPDADVTFKSSDGVLFHIHRKNLEVCTEGFPPNDISTQGEIVDLIETSATLELLFQFMYPQRHPALDTTPFEILEPLVEAAEKYQVFPAMNICHIHMRDMVQDHPVAVAAYAAKHDYPYLVSEAAPMMISMLLVDVIEMLPPDLVLPWVRYAHKSALVLDTIALVLPRDDISHTSGSRCSDWTRVALPRMSRLGAGIHSLRSLDRAFDSPEVPRALKECCKEDLMKWRRRMEAGITRIPKFSAFLYYP
ncbi:hypothetical protein DFH09DRAFT_1201855 [Mycena vulgaris]|nr:hypothetical protein DFH09DRAFT_1201855 [Mycena vulgaris]